MHSPARIGTEMNTYRPTLTRPEASMAATPDA